MQKPSDALLILTPEERDSAVSFIQRRLRTVDGEQAAEVLNLGKSARQQIRRLQAGRARFQSTDTKPAQVMLKLYDAALTGLAGLVAECNRAAHGAETRPGEMPSNPDAPDAPSGIEDEAAEDMAEFLLATTKEEEDHAASYIEERVGGLGIEQLGIFRDACRELLTWWESERGQAEGLAVEERNISIVEAEETGLGLSHASLGEELAASWGIPGDLIQAISHHHHPDRADLDPQLASLVHIADAVSRNLEIGSGGDPLVPAIQPFAFTQLSVDPEDLMAWEDAMKEELTKDMAFLSAIA